MSIPAPIQEWTIEIPRHLSWSTKCLVAKFAVAIAEKLRAAEIKYGYSDGWMDDSWRDELIGKLMEHVRKGDPRDVAAFCAFAWYHGWSIAPTPPQPVYGKEESAHRNFLGRLVRDTWVKWARVQPNSKPRWLDPWESLTEPEKEVDRQIGEAIWSGANARISSLESTLATKEERIAALELESDGYAVREKVLREWLAKVDVALAAVTRERDSLQGFYDLNIEYWKKLNAKFNSSIDELSSEHSAHEQTKRDRDEEIKTAKAVGNNLFGAILARMEPYFPDGSRDLDWDVLPSSIGGVCKERDELARQLAEAKESLEWANKTADGQRETLTKALEGAASAEKRNASLTRQLAEQEAVEARMREAINRPISGLPPHAYLISQFPAVQGHRPIMLWLDRLYDSVSESPKTALTQLVKAAFEEGWQSWTIRCEHRDSSSEILDRYWQQSDARRALGKESE